MSNVNIPIIDISGNQEQVAVDLVNAAVEHGFIYIKHTPSLDISPNAVEEAFGISRTIFDSPIEEKQRCTIQTNNRGWSGMHSETLDPDNQKVGDFKEAFNVGEYKEGKAQQPLPSTVQPKEPQVLAFFESCHQLCQKLLYLLGEGLEVGDFFASAHTVTRGESSSILRFLRYPPPDTTSHSVNDLRAGAHSDYGSITLLFRLKGQAGLEILRQGDTWEAVPVCPPGTEDDPSPPILVNIGDLLSYWTNGLFRSTVHRVAFPKTGTQDSIEEKSADPRYSIAFFCHPTGSTKLDPVPSDRVRRHTEMNPSQASVSSSEKKALTADEHLMTKLAATYGTLYNKA